MKDMSTETTKLLETISLKLGTTTERLWGVLIEQAPVTSSIHALGVLLLLGGVAYGWRKLMTVDWDSYEAPPKCVVVFFATVLTVGLSSIVLLELPGILSGFLNPEYWALRQLLPK